MESPHRVVHPGMARIYRERVERLSDLLADPDARDEAMAAIRSLIEKVVLTPEDGALRIDLAGDLAAILRLGGADATKPAAGGADGRAGDGLEQVKLVAGAGFAEAPTVSIAT